MRLRPILLAAALSGPFPAGASVCEVNPYAAWLAAQSRGWSFSCDVALVPGAVLSGTLLVEPPDRIGCRFRTGPAIQVQAPVRVRLSFFRPGPWGLPHAMLRNGWRVNSASFSAAPPVSTAARSDVSARVAAHADIDRPLSVIDVRLTRLSLHHPSQGCANVLTTPF